MSGHQVDIQHSLVTINQQVEVLLEDVLCHFEVAGQLGLGDDAGLLEEDRDTASDLDMTDDDLVVSEDLFSFYIIGYMTFVINPPGIKSSPCSLATPSTDQEVL